MLKYFRLSRVSAEKYLELRSLEIRYFIGIQDLFSNTRQLIPNKVATITVFLSRRLKPRWSKNMDFYDVSFEKWKGITFDELSWFMKPFGHGESNLARIERRFANLIDRGEQNMDLPCSSSRHPFFDRISRDAYTAKPLVVILTI